MTANTRPRRRKPLVKQLTELSPERDGSSASGATSSGRSTPIPSSAPPSTHSLSTARKQARRRRLFPTIEFASRVSHFDPSSSHRDFHGFFNLFWIGLAIMGITTMLRNYQDTGFPLRIRIWSLFTVKLWHLAIADFSMVASTGVAAAIHYVCRRSTLFGWSRGGVVLQSVYQVAWFAVWMGIPFWLEWTWTAQVFLLLHAMVLLMKMHSYAFYNGHLSETEKRLRRLDFEEADTSPAYLYPSADHTDGATSPKKSRKKRKTEVEKLAEQKQSEDEKQQAEEKKREIEVLREDLARELTSPMGNTTYPHNLTPANYIDFLLVPTLCYELEYPRTAHINWTSLISKIIATFGCIFLLTITSEEFILPTLTDASSRLLTTTTVSEKLLILAESISQLLFPFTLTFLLVFLVIFEYVLGAFAEITHFADRHFYADWWNSTDWMEFSREWNIPVYSFLRRHVYSASLPTLGKPTATVITFLISAVGHEIVMACITKKIRGYGFVCQMMQLPIFAMQRTRWVRERETLNNVFFWCSMIMGLSLICALYVLV